MRDIDQPQQYSCQCCWIAAGAFWRISWLSVDCHFSWPEIGTPIRLTLFSSRSYPDKYSNLPTPNSRLTVRRHLIEKTCGRPRELFAYLGIANWPQIASLFLRVLQFAE